MTDLDPEFLAYALRYSEHARGQRRALSDADKATLAEVEDLLAEDPTAHPGRTVTIEAGLHLYRHPDPPMEVTYRIEEGDAIISIKHLVLPKVPVVKPVFISYSHEDEEWLTEMRKYLEPLERQNLIRIWDDGEITAGSDWAKQIDSALNEAKAGLLLVSQDFLTSNFISRVELPRLLDAAVARGALILWVAVRPSTVLDSEIARFQAVHFDPPLSEMKPREREAQFVHIYEEIKKALAS